MIKFIRNLLQKPLPPSASPPEQALIVEFTYGSTDLTSLFQLEADLEAAIQRAEVGEYDGNEVAADGSDGTLYMYGPSADALYEIVRPILENTKFMAGAKVRIRYGPPGARSREEMVAVGT